MHFVFYKTIFSLEYLNVVFRRNDNHSGRERLGGSLSLVVMGDNSRSKYLGFETWHHILDGHDIYSL